MFRICFLLVLKIILLFVFPLISQAGQKVNWAQLNPLLKSSSSITNSGNPDDETECLLCHEKYIKAFGKTKHARVYSKGNKKVLGSSCETCHGPMLRHLKGKTRKERERSVISFKNISSRQKNLICLQCHEKAKNLFWRGSTHDRMEVSCNECHHVSSRRTRRKYFINENPDKVCFQCHRIQQAKLQRTSHMPLREGKMTCSNCHNPHGGSGPSQLNHATVTETCTSCHTEKRGPLIWEHAPVRESCITCHDPHGSNFPSLLKLKVPYLCQQCHMSSFHSSLLMDSSDLSSASEFMVGKGCLNCHSRIHGSNHPSGRRFQR